VGTHLDNAGVLCHCATLDQLLCRRLDGISELLAGDAAAALELLQAQGAGQCSVRVATVATVSSGLCCRGCVAGLRVQADDAAPVGHACWQVRGHSRGAEPRPPASSLLSHQYIYLSGLKLVTSRGGKGVHCKPACSHIASPPHHALANGHAMPSVPSQPDPAAGPT
jgi:hypothetical protein